MDARSVIIAIASPPGRSLRGIVRISGAGAMDLVDAATLDDQAQPELPRRTRGFHAETLRVLETLPSLVLRFPGPQSYTGEDSAEIQLPGNPVLLDRVIDALIARGRTQDLEVRRAGPGEFTARAFLNGRISLTEAEGVAATIAAQCDAELQAARLLTGGVLGRIADALVDELTTVLALVEAGIDFTDEEDVVAIARPALINRITPLQQRIDEVLSRAAGSESLEAIPWVVLAGEPNAGKSTLFNALLGHERAVVSPLAGTTRDVITEPLRIETNHGGAEVMLVDLAGRDDALDSLNRRMQASAADACARAELVLRCVPADAAAPAGDGSPREMIVRTKSDLADAAESPGGDGVRVCAISGRGLDDVRRAIAARLADRALSVAADALVLNARHLDALGSASENLAEARELATPEPGRDDRLSQPELVAAALRAALDDLGTLAGRITPDEILGRVFATFCIGK